MLALHNLRIKTLIALCKIISVCIFMQTPSYASTIPEFTEELPKALKYGNKPIEPYCLAELIHSIDGQNSGRLDIKQCYEALRKNKLEKDALNLLSEGKFFGYGFRRGIDASWESIDLQYVGNAVSRPFCSVFHI